MKPSTSTRRLLHVGSVCISTVVVVLIASFVACAQPAADPHYPSSPVRYRLTVLSSGGGSVIAPGQGTFEYDAGTVVALLAVAEPRHRFLGWEGKVDAGMDAEAASTTITMNDHCIVAASFVMEIWDWHDLHAVRYSTGSRCLLMNDLDDSTSGYDELASEKANGGMGWEPIGEPARPFVGSFDGQGYEIRDVFINRPHEINVSLFGYVLGGHVADLSVTDSTVIGGTRVGGLVGYNSGSVSNSHVRIRVSGLTSVGGLVGFNVGIVADSSSSGSVDGYENIGGLVGSNWGTVGNSYAAGTVTGTQNIGGLIGGTAGPGAPSAVTKCYATGSVVGEQRVGGLVGHNWGTVSNSYVRAGVRGGDWVGGLVGINGGSVNDSHSSGAASGYHQVGGLVGMNSGTVTNSCSDVAVIGAQNVGGLIGGNLDSGIVSRCYATGSVAGERWVGGLLGASSGTVASSFWDTQASGQATSDGGAGKTTAEMSNVATFAAADWAILAVAPGETDPGYTWNIVDGQTYPFLSWQPVS